MRFEHLTDVHAARHAERVEDDVDGLAVGGVRHVLDRQDLGDDALVVAAGELVTDADLALLGHVHPHELVDAGRQFVAVVTVEHLDVDDLADFAVRHLEAGVADFAGLLAEDGPQQALLGGQLGFALRRHLADEDVAGPTSAPTRMMPRSSRSARMSSLRFGMSRGILPRAELRVASIDFVLLDVDRREHVVLHQALGEDDGVLEVVALPRHERHEEVLAEGEFALVGRRTVGEDRASADLVALDDAGTW